MIYKTWVFCIHNRVAKPMNLELVRLLAVWGWWWVIWGTTLLLLTLSQFLCAGLEERRGWDAREWDKSPGSAKKGSQRNWDMNADVKRGQPLFLLYCLFIISLNYMKCNNSRATHLRTGEDGRGRSDVFEDLGGRRRCGWQALSRHEVQRAIRLLSWRVCLCWHYDEGSWRGGLGSPAPFQSNAPLTL